MHHERERAKEEWQAALAELRGRQFLAIDGTEALARDLLDFAGALRARAMEPPAPDAASPPLAFYWHDAPGAVSSPFTVNVVSTVVVIVSPGSVGLAPGATQQFQAAVTGTPNTAVTWKVNGATGGDPSVGLITQSGLYTAPAAVPKTSGPLNRSLSSYADAASPR